MVLVGNFFFGMTGTDNIPARGGRGLGGYDYYTFTYDEEDGYEEDSLPGNGVPQRSTTKRRKL